MRTIVAGLFLSVAGFSGIAEIPKTGTVTIAAGQSITFVAKVSDIFKASGLTIAELEFNSRGTPPPTLADARLMNGLDGTTWYDVESFRCYLYISATEVLPFDCQRQASFTDRGMQTPVETLIWSGVEVTPEQSQKILAAGAVQIKLLNVKQQPLTITNVGVNLKAHLSQPGLTEGDVRGDLTVTRVLWDDGLPDPTVFRLLQGGYPFYTCQVTYKRLPSGFPVWSGGACYWLPKQFQTE